MVNGPDQLASIREQLRCLLIGEGVGVSEREAIVLATAEALDNALLACRPPDCRVEVLVSLIAHYVCIEVRDAGAGIRGACLNLPKLADAGQEHRRGLYLMRELTESLELVPRSQGTLVRMTKLLGGHEPTNESTDGTRLAS